MDATKRTLCPRCSGERLSETWVPDDFKCLAPAQASETQAEGASVRTVTLSVNIPVVHCADCGLDYTDHRAEDLRAATVRAAGLAG